MADELTLKFRVHGVNPIPVAADAEIKGKMMRVHAEGIEVELASMDTSHGSITFRFLADEAVMAKSIFTPDATIDVMFSSENVTVVAAA
jgi:hypothetical protein